MGQFSWLDCITKEQILDNVRRKSYLLVPQEFGGGHIEETCYQGYGVFGGKDAYDLVADWNKPTLLDHYDKKPQPTRESFGQGEFAEQHYQWAVERHRRTREMISDFQKGKADEVMFMDYGSDWKRRIGIAVACRNEDNAALDYPIKITHDPDAVYENCSPSDGDPNQGWPWWQRIDH